MSEELILLVVLPLDEAKSLKAQLLNVGVSTELNHNEQTCNRGCSVTVELWGRASDLEQIRDVYQTNFQKMASDHSVDWNIINSTFDENQAEATCPACATQFSTQLSECPECGLVFR
jgi:hypothetical protein